MTSAVFVIASSSAAVPLSVKCSVMVRVGVASRGCALRLRDATHKLAPIMAHSESRQARFDELAAALAQELRNPLSTITIMLELLREELASGMRAETGTVRRVDAALEELKRLDRVFAEFLRFAREPQLELRPGDVNRLIEDALGALSAELLARRV